MRDLSLITLLQNARNIECYLVTLEKLLDLIKENKPSKSTSNFHWNDYRFMETEGCTHVVEKLDKIDAHIKERGWITVFSARINILKAQLIDKNEDSETLIKDGIKSLRLFLPNDHPYLIKIETT